MKVFALLLFSCFSVSVATAQTFVDANASGANDGTSWADAYTGLQEAIYNAGAGDTLWVRQGTYYPSIDTLGMLPASPETRSFWLKSGIVVYGGFNGTETTLAERDPINLKATLEGHIDTSYASNVINIYNSVDSTAIMDGFIVLNGRSTVTSVNKSGAALLLRGDAGFYNMEFRNNLAYNHGGAVYAEYSSSLFVSCRFADNETIQYDGAAANLVYSDVRMYNCVFAGNHANRFGAAITTVESDLLVQNGTFVANTGGSNIFQFSTSGTINLNNCIFTADNTATVIVGSSGGVSNFRECLLPIATDWMLLCPTCFSGAPSFTDAASGDYSLMDGSMGIDETLVTAPVNNYDDIAGNPRLVGSSMDLGAYENEGLVGLPSASAMEQLTVFPNPASSTLTVLTSQHILGISIFNAAGTQVQSASANQFAVDQLPAGMYLIQVSTDAGVSRLRFVKE